MIGSWILAQFSDHSLAVLAGRTRRTAGSLGFNGRVPRGSWRVTLLHITIDWIVLLLSAIGLELGSYLSPCRHVISEQHTSIGAVMAEICKVNGYCPVGALVDSAVVGTAYRCVRSWGFCEVWEALQSAKLGGVRSSLQAVSPG